MTRPTQHDIFTGTSRARSYGGTTPPRGYAAAPGTGPEGETCRTCRWCRWKQFRSRRYYKCGRMTMAWTHGRESDINVRTPACRLWEGGQPTETGIR